MFCMQEKLWNCNFCFFCDFVGRFGSVSGCLPGWIPLARKRSRHYPKPDGKRYFSKTDSVRLTGTNHTEDQPCHLVIKDPKRVIPINYAIYGGPEQFYCPANVYEYIKTNQKVVLQINGQNCIHCKTCAIKDPGDNIEWLLPQGGEGPRYSET